MSKLAKRFPFIFGLLVRHHWLPTDTQENNSLENACPKELDSQKSIEIVDRAADDDVPKDSDKYSAEEEYQEVTSSKYSALHATRCS